MFLEHGLRAPKIYPEPMQTQFEHAYQFAVVTWIVVIVFVLPGLVLLGLGIWKAWPR
jgi:hypothetical protein